SARPGGPSFLVLALLGLVANLPGDLLDYALGRAGGPWVRRRLARLRRRTGAVRMGGGGLRRDDALLILLTRFFFTAIASPVSALAGASGITLRAFLLLDVAGKALYVCGYLALGRAFGAHALTRGPLVVLVPLVTLVPLLASALLRRVGRGAPSSVITTRPA
ncbi:MAG: VTT domain-containing protein, partial [Ktedonobacterales bacterium]|nr:VTT domain-containing protein [Ktedonobacterales bacterium]